MKDRFYYYERQSGIFLFIININDWFGFSLDITAVSLQFEHEEREVSVNSKIFGTKMFFFSSPEPKAHR